MTNQLPVGRFIDPFTDFGFKFLFGSEPNKDILIEFLNQLFQGQKKIRDLVFSPTEHVGEDKNTKTVVFDLLCTGENGEKFIVEMQRAEQSFFKERSVFYTSRAIHEQLPKGRKSWDYQLTEVYLIALLEFSLADTPANQYLHQVQLMNKDTCQVFYNKLEYKFIEIPKFAKTEDQLDNDFDRWLYLLKNLSRLDKIPVFLKKKIFQRVFKIAEIGKLSKEARMAYHLSLKAKWDHENVMAFQKQKAREAGLAEGRAEGLAEGLAEGEAKGEHKKALETARKMKTKGYSVSAIAEITELPIKEIEKLPQYQS